MTEKDFALVSWALKENTEAINFFSIIQGCARVLDDLIDRDREVSNEDIIAAWWDALILLPQNGFYLRNLDRLSALIQRGFTDWIVSNEIQKTDQVVAYVLRNTLYSIVIDCAFIIGGYQWGRAVSGKVTKEIHSETLEEYKNSLKKNGD